MAKVKGKRAARKDAYTEEAAIALLAGLKSNDMLHLVARFCGLEFKEPSSLRSLARVLTRAGIPADRDYRKGVAVLSRRLHDRLPRFPNDGVLESSAPITLASCLENVCHTEVAATYSTLSRGDSAPSPAMSCDENEKPPSSTGTIGEDLKMSDGVRNASKHLINVQAFCACLYTQDLVSEELIHGLLERVRCGPEGWSVASYNAALHGACEMMTYCGKRLESLGARKQLMPAFYSYVQQSLQEDILQEDTKKCMAYVLHLRDNKWQVNAVPTISEAEDLRV